MKNSYSSGKTFRRSIGGISSLRLGENVIYRHYMLNTTISSL